MLPGAARGEARRRSRSASGAPAAPRGQEAYTARDRAGRGARRRRVPRAREDLRHRHRRGRARPGAARAPTPRKEVESVPAPLRERYFERTDQRWAFRKDLRRVGHLRSQQPRPRRADLAAGPADLPQHADVLQRGDAGAHPAPLPLRAARRRRADAREVRDAALAPRPVRAASTSRSGSSARQPRDLLQARALGFSQRRRAAGAGDEPAEPRRCRWSSAPHPLADRRRRRRRADVRQPARRRALFQLALDDLGRPFARARRSRYRPVELRRRIELVLRERRRVRGRRGGASRRSAAKRAASTSQISPLLSSGNSGPRREHRVPRRHALRRAPGRARAGEPARPRDWPTRSCSRRSRSSRRPTRSSSRPTRSSRPPTRSSSRPTRSSRR